MTDISDPMAAHPRLASLGLRIPNISPKVRHIAPDPGTRPGESGIPSLSTGRDNPRSNCCLNIPSEKLKLSRVNHFYTKSNNLSIKPIETKIDFLKASQFCPVTAPIIKHFIQTTFPTEYP